MAILSHLAVVIGMVLIGARHFDNMRTGISAAALYLMLPYTAQMTGRVDHVLPAALLVWAVFAYRRPVIAGGLLGLATGAIYYPVFLLPLWLGFYWQRGLLRFSLGFLTMLSVLVATLAFTSSNLEAFLAQAKQMFGWTSLSPGHVEGFWAFNEAAGPLPHLGVGGLCGALRRAGAVAGPQEPGHADELLGRRDAGHAVLARARRRALHVLVPAAVAADDLPAESRGPRRAVGAGRKLVRQTPRASDEQSGVRHSVSGTFGCRYAVVSWSPYHDTMSWHGQETGQNRVHTASTAKGS